MSWSGFKKNVGRATTQVMMKTGHVEKTSDREYEVEERRYRTLESASLRLQKEAKGYLDSLRAMTASQMRIAETIDAFYGDSGAKDGVSRSYKQAVEDLDAETVKALDGPYRCVANDPILRDLELFDKEKSAYRKDTMDEIEADLNFTSKRRIYTKDAVLGFKELLDLIDHVHRTTVLEPINRFCAYFPDINECIKKRNHKMLDYDAMRSKVKKLTEKPDKDPAKLPRTEKETEMVNDPSSLLDLPPDYFDYTTEDDDSFVVQSPSKPPKPLGRFQKHRQKLAKLAEDDEPCLQTVDTPASRKLKRKSSLWKRLSSVTAHAHTAFWGQTEAQQSMSPGQPPPSPVAILRRSSSSPRQSPLAESFHSPSLAPISEKGYFSPVNMTVGGQVFNPGIMNGGGMVPRSAYGAQPSKRSPHDTPSRSTTLGNSFLSDHSSPEDTPSRATSMGPSFLFKRSPLATPSRKHSMPLHGTSSSEFSSPSGTPSRFPAGRFTALNAPSTASVATIVEGPAQGTPTQSATQRYPPPKAPDFDSVTIDSVASSAASWQTTSTGAYTDVEPDVEAREMDDGANSHAESGQDTERKDSLDPLGIYSAIESDICSEVDTIVEQEDSEEWESESTETDGQSQSNDSGENATGLGITSAAMIQGSARAQTRPVHPLERSDTSLSDDAPCIDLSSLDGFIGSPAIAGSLASESPDRDSPPFSPIRRVPATSAPESVASSTSSYDEELEQAMYDVEQGLYEHTDRSSGRHPSKLVARSPRNEHRGHNLSLIKLLREGPPDSSQRPVPRNISSTSTTGAWQGYTDGEVRHSAVPLPLYPSESVTALPKMPSSRKKRTPFFEPSELEDIMQPLKQEFIEKQTDLLVQAKSAYDQLNEQLTNELPQLIDLRVPYLDPSFEALVKIQLRFCAEAYSRMAQVQQYLAAETRDQYASGDLDARVEDVLGQIRELSIAGTV